MRRSIRSDLQRLPLTLAVIAALQAAPAFAQDQPTTGSQDDQQTAQTTEQKVEELDKIIVTGSLLNKPEYETTSPIQVISIQKAKAAGQFDTADFLQTSAAASGSTQINNQFGGFVVEGGTGVQTVSLRGLGANRNLVLLDGQRPGPAGTRGQVGAFDLNVIPQAILQRIEIVKDGSSSIYGSDAVSGVINLITRKNIDKTELEVYASSPQDGGGEQFSASIATGWNFDNGSIIAAAQWDKLNSLKHGDRDYFRCAEDLVYGTDGQRIDREDRSILAGTDLAGCNNLYANTIIRYFNPNVRYVPSPDGSTIGPFPGYRPRPFPARNYANSPQAYYEDVLNFPFVDSADLVDQRDRISLYGATDFAFDKVNWKTQWLFNRRNTRHHDYRQFFPVVYNAADDDYYEPIMPFVDDTKVQVDYFYGATKFDGMFSPTSSWGWTVNGTYSRSKGDYEHLDIDGRITGDLTDPANESADPPVDYFDPGFLSGARLNELVDALGVWTRGTTVYEQTTINANVTGNLFSLPAGDVASAFGVEYRRYSINDEPDQLQKNAQVWGYSSAQTTKGTDNVKEAVAEIDVPLLKGKPGFESLSVDLSGRLFQYDSVPGTDNVWKGGLNWQIIPSLRVRGTIGTSFRAPGLYELYLGNQTGFLAQTQIDPCVNYQDSDNEFLRANCAAAGIPANYSGAGSSATIFSGGGKGFLKPETSRAKSLGVVWAPTFANLNVALDYFDYKIKGEITQLDAFDIVNGCYGSPVFPNAFCNQIERNPSNATANPNQITAIHNTYININQERTRGYDLQVNYDNDFSFGKLSLDAQVTYTIEDVTQFFSSASESGQESSDRITFIGSPRTVGLANASLKRGDWTYSWQGNYVSSTENHDLNPTFTYQGYANATRDIKAEWQFRHNMSVNYDHGNWNLTVGVRNVFDKAPPLMSTGTATRYGNVPAFATQYDWYGRTYFARVGYKF
jgi:iron complex outermembrane receptor protein